MRIEHDTASDRILYLLKVGAEVADPTKAMVEIATDARRYGVHMNEVEPNFGQCMSLPSSPSPRRSGPRAAPLSRSEWAKGQKETRIIDILEPVLTQHRPVVAKSFLREDAAVEDRNYSFHYQLTRLSWDRGALVHDDPVDAVAGAVAHFQRAMMMDVDQAAKAMKGAEMEAEIRGLTRRVQPARLPRHAGQWGSGCRSAQASEA
jgi:hypothetical protein